MLAQPASAQNDRDVPTSVSVLSAEDVEGAPPPSTEDPSAPIVVTGSRIRRDEFSSPAPITVVNPEVAVKAGMMDTSDMIQGSPIASGSSQITAAISTNYITNGGIGAQTISLRGLGAERTLVLLNGRRAGPAGVRGAVSAFDLNVLPQSIVERVDILKDGASSIYGSDAVAGVVNLITKTDTDGIEFDVFGSAPFSSGGETWSASATWGKEFDRGHILVSGNYYKRNELARGDRSYLQCEEVYSFTDETYTTRADLVDPRTGRPSCGGDESNITWGHVWTYDYNYYYFDGTTNVPFSDGQGHVSLLQYNYPGDRLDQFGYAIPSPTHAGHIGVPDGWFIVSEDARSESIQNNYHPLMNNDSVIPKMDRWTAYLDASYELTDSIEFYTELLYNKRDTFVNASGQPYIFGYGETLDYVYDYDGDGRIDPEDEVYIPFDPLAPGWHGAALFSPTGFTDQNDSSVGVEYYRGVAGFRGDIGGGWTYDVYSQYSRSNGTYRDQVTLADALDMSNFRTESCVGQTTPVSNKPCVDIDWYDPYILAGEFSQAQKDFLFQWEEGHTKYTQFYVEAITTGDLFELPAGTVGVALGVNYREDKINDTPGEVTLADNGFQSIGAGVTAGKTITKEAFGELNVPVLRDIPMIERFELSAAARLTEVKAIRASDGVSDKDSGNWTYKLSANWEVTDWLRFRGTYGTSFRAPALFEQFLGAQKGGLSQRTIDPCIQWANNLAKGAISQLLADNCAADGVPGNHLGSGVSSSVYTSGTIGKLNPETSTAWTASAILTPRLNFLPDTDISIAVDYFDIEVKDEITQLGTSILTACYLSPDFPNDPLCSLFGRFDDIGPGHPDYQPGGDPSNVAFINDDYLNVASQKNRGVDVTIRAIHDFGGDATLTLQSQMTWQTKDEVTLFPGSTPENLNGEVGEPKWVGDFSATLDIGDWSLFYNLDVIGAADSSADWIEDNGSLCQSYVTLGDICLKLSVPATFYHNISISRSFMDDRLQLTAGISNLFNTRPPRVTSIGGNGVQNFGQGVLYSQYDLLGIRAFMNASFKY
jgi:iron complex outermembrane receptor protein